MDGFAQHGHRNLEWSSLELHRVSQGCSAFAVANGKGGMQDRNYITQRAVLVRGRRDTRPMTTQDRAGTSRGGGGRTSDDVTEADGCRGPAPADPGYSKERRRRRGSGNNCLIKR